MKKDKNELLKKIKKDGDERKENLSSLFFKIPSDNKEILKELSKSRGISIATLLNEILNDYINSL